jgi:hypothetical protein
VLFTLLIQTPNLQKFVYPLAPPIAAPVFKIDTSDAPQTLAWAKIAQRLAAEWFPAVTSMLATEHYAPPKSITFVFKKDLEVPAYAAGDTITINGKWVTQHPDDFGVIIHEMTHIIQGYPDSDKTPGWLVEGIADYIRWFRFEPDAPRPRIDRNKSKYTDAYRTTAAFLAWVTGKYDHRLVPALDRACRNRRDPMPVFKQLTGKTADELWAEFIKNY